MEDASFLQDLAQIKATSKHLEAMHSSGITTYSQVFDLLRDEMADTELRISACWSLHYLSKKVDKRRAVPALLTALKSSNNDVRKMVLQVLGVIDSALALQPLTKIVQDRTESQENRGGAIRALSSINDQRSAPMLTQIAFDETEHLEVRNQAIEWNPRNDDEQALNDYITLLSDPLPDIRFWAAYRLSQFHSDVDLSPALNRLDQIVAYDNALPNNWGWHISREAIYPFETIYSRLFGLVRMEDGYWFSLHPWLISPAAEYDTFISKYRRWNPDWMYTTDTVPPVKLKVNPDWLADKLRENWPDIEINTREPRPQAYLLDWKVIISEQPLIGGLLRDQYGVVLTGEDHAVNAFAAWYRSIIAPEFPLSIYEWADVAIELHPGMTAGDLAATQAALLESRLRPLAND